MDVRRGRTVEILVREGAAVDGLSAGAVSGCEVSTCSHQGVAQSHSGGFFYQLWYAEECPTCWKMQKRKVNATGSSNRGL